MKNANYFGRLTKHLENPEKYSLPEDGNHYLELLKTTYKDYPRGEAFYMMVRDMTSRPINKCGHEKKFNSEHRKYVEVCPICGRKPHNKTKVEIDGITYTSKESARKKLNLTHYQLESIIHDEEYLKNKIISKYSFNGVITKELLQKEVIDNRLPIKYACQKLGIKRSHLSDLMKAYGLETKWAQLEQSTYEFLNDEERFRAEFCSSNSVELAYRYNCSETTILQTADRYGVDRTPRFQSQIERTVIDYIKSIDGSLEVIPRDTSAIGMEIDVYIPSKKIGIELDGLFFHTDSPPFDSRNKHSEKQKLAFKNDVTLLRFTDIDETISKLDIVKSIISSKLGYCNRIFARKCNIKELTNEECKDFFEKNHLNGFKESYITFGLFFENELVQCCSFSKNDFITEADWELTRFATKNFYTVVGGLSKLLTAFKKKHSGKIITSVDLRHGNGTGYLKVGFKYLYRTHDDCFYTDMKQKIQRSDLRLENYDSNLSEVENAWNNGFRRYKDCGSLKFVLDYER